MEQVADTKVDSNPLTKAIDGSEKSESHSKNLTEEVPVAENKHEQKEAIRADITNGKNNNIMMQNDNLDELSSLEQEIAKMHNIEPSGQDEQANPLMPEDAAAATTSRSSSASVSGANEIKNDISQKGMSINQVNGLNHVRTETEQITLEEVDLIALLKGTDTSHEQGQQEDVIVKEKPTIELALAELENVGVTIEGEGQYEIMEIDDDDHGPDPNISKVSGSKKSIAVKPTVNVQKKPYGKTKLSPEQARAVALEQMADLKYEAARRKEAAGVKTLDIINSLNDDWNEYDSGSDSASNSVVNKKSPTKKLKSIIDQSHLDSKPIVNSVVVVKAAPLQSVVPVDQPISANIGFKRTRIIKPKIIWDPDVPETQKSYSQYASTKTATTQALSSVNALPISKANALPNTEVIINVLKKEPVPKKPRTAPPKERQRAVNTLSAATKRAVAPSKVESSVSPNRALQTPKTVQSNGASSAKKKKISEIDRLMGDEGAANMIQAVEHEQRELIGGSEEAANKPLMRKRALTITGRSQRATDVRPTTPKKEPKEASCTPKSTKRITSIEDAEANAIFAKTASAGKPRESDSWDYVYKQRASEESMIMRRRSNSSYSSNASVSRLSLDNKPNANSSDDADTNDPSFKFLKPENKTNQRSCGISTAAHTLTSDLKRAPQQKEQKTGIPNVSKADLVVLHKLEKVAQLVINTQRAKASNTYTTQMLHKLTDTLNKVAKSNEYNTVLLVVQGQHFCQGIDCQELIVGSVEKRKNSASQLASALKTYLKTLAAFPKPLVAGIVGNLKNLGVMQLPLMDYVVAADECSFETNYAKLGHLPEGYALWHNHPKVSASVHSRLFLLNQRLQTTDLVAPHSLIDSVKKSHNVVDEALSVAQHISATTAENYRTLKKINHTANSKTLDRLEEEFQIIAEQWTTASCQTNFKRYFNDITV